MSCMFCKIWKLLSIVSLTIVLTTVDVQSQRREASSIPVTSIPVVSLWQPNIDICQDPVHGGLHLNANSDLAIDDAVWTELRIKMRGFRYTLLQNKLRFERRICQQDMELLGNYTLRDFVQTNVTTEVYQVEDNAVQLYRGISEMVYILSILDSDGARQCCQDNRLIFSRLRNQVLPEVYNLVSGAILNWPIRSCIMRMTTTFIDHVTCEEVRNLVLLVYKYGLEYSELILQHI